MTQKKVISTTTIPAILKFKLTEGTFPWKASTSSSTYLWESSYAWSIKQNRQSSTLAPLDVAIMHHHLPDNRIVMEMTGILSEKCQQDCLSEAVTYNDPHLPIYLTKSHIPIASAIASARMYPSENTSTSAFSDAVFTVLEQFICKLPKSTQLLLPPDLTWHGRRFPLLIVNYTTHEHLAQFHTQSKNNAITTHHYARHVDPSFTPQKLPIDSKAEDTILSLSLLIYIGKCVPETFGTTFQDSENRDHSIAFESGKCIIAEFGSLYHWPTIPTDYSSDIARLSINIPFGVYVPGTSTEIIRNTIRGFC